MSKNNTSSNIKNTILIGMFAAVLAILSQLSIPMPSGVPITLQTFAVALTGCILGCKLASASTVVYLLLGAVGVPVFANLKGGFNVLIGYTGGFLWGFIFMAFFCGFMIQQKNVFLRILLGFLGLFICHFLGVLQYSLVAHVDLIASFLLVSAPYLIKDSISVACAYFLSILIRKRIVNLLPSMIY